MPHYPIRIIDAFTDTLFGGNQAAVMILPHWLPETLMQAVAAENNLAETAFVVAEGEAWHYRIRWFSPLTEIDFCGHATLAAAWALFDDHPQAETLYFHAEAVGELAVTRHADGLQMRFPPRLAEAVDSVPEALGKGLSIAPREVLRSPQAYFVVYPHAADVLNVRADDHILKQLAPYDVVVTAAAEPDSGHDFVSRYFWPANGGSEDAVTGSIHAGLAPFWAHRLGKTELTAYQASVRGGRLHCRVTDDAVYITGRCVVYLEGRIDLPAPSPPLGA